MSENAPYSHNLSLDRPINIATDNIFTNIPRIIYNAVPPPGQSLFLLSDGTDFLLSDGSFFLLTS